jgi:hypothetical protein
VIGEEQASRYFAVRAVLGDEPGDPALRLRQVAVPDSRGQPQTAAQRMRTAPATARSWASRTRTGVTDVQGHESGLRVVLHVSHDKNLAGPTVLVQQRMLACG